MPQPQPQPQPQPSESEPDPVLSMFDDASPPRPLLVDPLGLGAAPAAARRRPPPAVVGAPEVDRGPPAQPVPTARLPAADRDELTRAFLDGLGCANLALAPLTPEAMARIGRLLREATQGTLDLLMARALTKREVRAEATMIVSKDNNPLKFSPSAEAALAHLLAPQGQGFMAPVDAMRDAYDDLRSHQFGFMAGLRAALAGVLRRFDPGVLGERLAHTTSILDSVLPINRRAKRWDLYEKLYREIANEAEEDFHTLFGREFLRAYEEQVERLERRPESGSAPPG